MIRHCVFIPIYQFDILLRLPPLYMMDGLLGYNLGVTREPSLQPVVGDQVNLTEQISQSTDLYTTFTVLYGGSPALLRASLVILGSL